MGFRKVKIIDRSTWGTSGPYPNIISVEIMDTCIRCGGPRGEPREESFSEDGGFYSCHRWENPCGHIDTYDKCLEEHRKIQINKR